MEMYMEGQSFTLSGGEVVEGGAAASLSYYGTTNNTQVSFTGNTSFTGTLYAPQADLKMGGGGSSVYDCVGSIVARTITLNGHFNFHFDEALTKQGPYKGFVAVSWREM
jgi:hypothetical protein